MEDIMTSTRQRILAAVVLIPVACAVVFAQNANEQNPTTSPTTAGPAVPAERLAIRDQKVVTERFQLPGLQNRPNQSQRPVVDLFRMSGQENNTPVPDFIFFEGRIYAGGWPMPGGGWCWESSDVAERRARLRAYLATHGLSGLPLPRK
jgi:hypothetical protein